MKFHFGHHSHHLNSGGSGGHDQGSANNGRSAIIVQPAHPSSDLLMDAHLDDPTVAAVEESCSLSSSAAMSSSLPSVECHEERGGSNNYEAAENDPSLALEPTAPSQQQRSKSRPFFRIKGRRSRSSSPVNDDSSSGQQQQQQRQEISEQQHGQQQHQHRLNVMDLLRPRLRRSTSLPHTSAAATATASTTNVSTSNNSSGHSITSNQTSKQHKRCVTFTNIQIREYNTILGDHPCCQSGPPLALGWEYKHEEMVIDIDDYDDEARRRSKDELRLNCEDRREILCGLMKPVDDTTITTTTTSSSSAVSSTMMEQDGSDENQPQFGIHPNDSLQVQPHIAASEAAPATGTPLYTKEELRKAERKLERDRRCNSSNAARTRRRLKRGFFMPLTPEEEESYKLNSGVALSGPNDDDNDEQSEYSSSEDENGVVSMDISPQKEALQN
eukprot:scaffold5669_cov144-Skeletonema_menzelii.AAC.1